LPLPSERTDVAGLLSETLDEEAPPEAGTRPVTVDAETGGVREERPSEFSMSLEGGEPALASPADPAPARAPSEPPPARPPSVRPPLPVPVAPQRDEDDTTTVYERSEIEAFAQKQDREAEALAQNPTPLRPPPEAVTAPPMVPPEPAKAAPAAPVDPVAAPPIPAAIRPAPLPIAAPPPPGAPAAPPLAPPPVPVTSQAAFAGTLIAPPRAPTGGLGGTAVLPPPTPPPAIVEAPAPTVVIEGPASFSAYAAPSVQATSRGFPAQAAAVESLPRAVRPAEVHTEVPIPSEPGKIPTRNTWVLVVIGVLALALGVSGTVFLLQGSKAKPTTTDGPPTPSEVVPPTAPGVLEPNVPRPPSGETPRASDTTTAAPPPASAAPEPPAAQASASAAPTEGVPTGAPGAPPAVPPASFDLTKLPSDRAALVVHSSANARVFVHGRDYGETNQYLMTTCGIRFVRIGRGFNDFLEPGRSIVVKCGRVTEVAIEPDH
jgi:hypothetical protein